MKDIYTKALCALRDSLRDEELYELFERLDGDPHDGLFEKLADLVVDIFPDRFVMPEGMPEENDPLPHNED